MKKIKVLAIIIIILIFTIISFILNKNLSKNKISEFKETIIEIDRTENNYAKASSAEELIENLSKDEIQIIEIQNDIDLGYNLANWDSKYSEIIQKHNEPLTHPILKETGVSKLKIQNKDGLIIFSENGSKILHCNIIIENSRNIKISNIKMEELWEWDEETQGEYDRNNWDYITIKNSENIAIEKCDFSKAYDGITDIDYSKNVTISNCNVVEIDVNNEFYNMQFEELEQNMNDYAIYSYLRKEIGLDIETIKNMVAYQFKVYNIGSNKENSKNTNIIIHDCTFKNVKTRIPMARNSSVYVYNSYVEATTVNKKMLNKKDYKKIKKTYPKIVSFNSHGAISIKNSYMVIENCVYKGFKYTFNTYHFDFFDSFGIIKQI